MEKLRAQASKEKELRREEEKTMKNLSQDINELNTKYLSDQSKLVDKLETDIKLMEQNIKKLVEETQVFQDVRSFSDLVEENKKTIGRQMDDIKQKVNKLEMNYHLTLQTQVDVLRGKVQKNGDSQAIQNKEIFSSLKSLEKKLTEHHDTKIDYKKISQEISNCVDSKLVDYTLNIEKSLENLKRLSTQFSSDAPEVSLDGKHYIYIKTLEGIISIETK